MFCVREVLCVGMGLVVSVGELSVIELIVGIGVFVCEWLACLSIGLG